jgi:oxygen-dependent protoporphyrinogen oxidase
MKKQHIVIVGAGISGLALGWFLKAHAPHPFNLTILEKENRVGGYIQTVYKENFCFETGPHSLRLSPENNTLLPLIQALKLEPELIPAHSSAHTRYLWANHELHALPKSFWGMITSPFMRPLLWHLLRELWQPRKKTSEDETIYDFISRRFGPLVAEQLIDPLTTGIYAGDIRKLSVRACFSMLHTWEEKYGSIILGGLKSGQRNSGELFSFKRGMHTLPASLAKHLEEHIFLSSAVEAICPCNKGIELVLQEGQILNADHLFITIPLHSLSPIIHPHHASLADKMRSIPYASIAAVHLGFRRNILKNHGFGHLIPRQEKEAILGAIWSSSAFPAQNHYPQETRLTVLLGGVHSPRLILEPPESLQKIAENALKRQLGVQISADVIHTSIAHAAIPQYLLGHQKEVEYMKKEIYKISPFLQYTGTGFAGVSLGDCIQSAAHIAQEHWQKVLKHEIF